MKPTPNFKSLEFKPEAPRRMSRSSGFHKGFYVKQFGCGRNLGKRSGKPGIISKGDKVSVFNNVLFKLDKTGSIQNKNFVQISQ